MVLWEITAITAYFLGLKRTYKLALRIQRRLIGPNHPKIRGFLHRRTRAIFDVAVSVHQNIQQRDIEVGRNIGNWVLRWLDRMKPSAQIRSHPEMRPTNNNIPTHVASSGQQPQRSNINNKPMDRESKGRLLFTSLNMRPKSFPNIAMMMKPMSPAGMNGGQYRHYFSHYAPCTPAIDYRLGRRSEGVLRKDIALWMLRN